MAEGSATPRVLFVAEIGLRVADLDAMIAFYREVLGFEPFLRAEAHAFLEIADLPSPLGRAGHAQILGLFARDAAPDIARSTLDHLAFEIAPEDYEAERQRFLAKGMVVRERNWPDSLDWRGRSFFFRDPEGNVIEIIAALPSAEPG